MEISGGGYTSSIRSDHLRKDESEEIPLQGLELGFSDHGHGNNYQFQSMNALDILRETVRILRFNSWAFMAIMVLLICPVSAVFLSNILVDQSIVKSLTTRLLLFAKTSGFP